MARYIHLEPYLNPKVEVRPSPIHGQGMFASEPIEMGDIIVVWSDGVTDEKGARSAKAEGKGTMQWDDDVFSVEMSPEESDPDMYKMNHSCEPNCWMTELFVMVAMQDIAKDEEITTDYVAFVAEKDRPPRDCLCGSEKCRGQLKADDWKLPEIQERYRGHFTPLLEKWIQNENDRN